MCAQFSYASPLLMLRDSAFSLYSLLLVLASDDDISAPAFAPAATYCWSCFVFLGSSVLLFEKHAYEYVWLPLLHTSKYFAGRVKNKRLHIRGTSYSIRIYAASRWLDHDCQLPVDAVCPSNLYALGPSHEESTRPATIVLHTLWTCRGIQIGSIL